MQKPHLAVSTTSAHLRRRLGPYSSVSCPIVRLSSPRLASYPAAISTKEKRNKRRPTNAANVNRITTSHQRVDGTCTVFQRSKRNPGSWPGIPSRVGRCSRSRRHDSTAKGPAVTAKAAKLLSSDHKAPISGPFSIPARNAVVTRGLRRWAVGPWGPSTRASIILGQRCLASGLSASHSV